ncbi:hypothetical protein EJD97_020750 [Solanum chilense]|uniref:Uncharacterized protein n=1 Tax=Solanum chilense TaxID=4083 RepID=A0A6N2CCU6_SOLCI|nr:hypothetical protein EJD97_020750 [Solanum chilense]
MNTRRTTSRRVGDEIVNAGATPPGNQVPLHVQYAMNDQFLVNSLATTDDQENAVLFQIALAITIQAQSTTTQTNKQVIPRENQQSSTMSRCLRDFTRVSTTEKAELVFYQLKDVAKTWYNK